MRPRPAGGPPAAARRGCPVSYHRVRTADVIFYIFKLGSISAELCMAGSCARIRYMQLRMPVISVLKIESFVCVSCVTAS